MELTQQEIWDIFLNQIMEANNVSFKSINECMETNEDEIDAMDTLFDSYEDISIRKRLVLLHIISQDRSKENMEYYRNNVEYSNEASMDSDLEKYKTLLIASLIFNIDFFIMACNWCGFIQAEVKKRNTNEEPSNCQQVLALVFFKNEQNYEQITGFKPKKVMPKYILWVIPFPISAGPSAAGSEATIFKEISITYEGIKGKLRFIKEPHKETFYEFIFDEYQDIVPFELELRFTTICGKKKKKHKINIPWDKGHIEKNRKKNKTKITSKKYYDVDLSDGIEANYEIIIKLLDS